MKFKYLLPSVLSMLTTPAFAARIDLSSVSVGVAEKLKTSFPIDARFYDLADKTLRVRGDHEVIIAFPMAKTELEALRDLLGGVVDATGYSLKLAGEVHVKDQLNRDIDLRDPETLEGRLPAQTQMRRGAPYHRELPHPFLRYRLEVTDADFVEVSRHFAPILKGLGSRLPRDSHPVGALEGLDGSGAFGREEDNLYIQEFHAEPPQSLPPFSLPWTGKTIPSEWLSRELPAEHATFEIVIPSGILDHGFYRDAESDGTGREAPFARRQAQRSILDHLFGHKFLQAPPLKLEHAVQIDPDRSPEQIAQISYYAIYRAIRDAGVVASMYTIEIDDAPLGLEDGVKYREELETLLTSGYVINGQSIPRSRITLTYTGKIESGCDADLSHP